MKVVMRAVTQFLRVILVSALVSSTLAVVAPLVASHAPAGAAGAADGVPVMGPSILTADQLANWFRATGRTPALPVTIDQMARYYLSEGKAEGVRGDLAFAQSVVETGYFGFVGSIVKPANFNYAGMGACDSCNSGRQFPTPRAGVRAQIQHLKNFADPTSRAALLAHRPVVEWYGHRSDGTLDPVLAVYNFDHFFAKGTAPTWNAMGGPGKWASAPTYGTVILQIYNRILTFNGQAGSCPADRLAFGLGEARECPLSIRQAGRAVTAGSGGYYVLNGDGAINAVGAPYYGSPAFQWDIARDIQATPDGLGYVVLDGYGGVHLFGSAATGPLKNVGGPYWQGFDIARSIALTADGGGYFILDGFGGVHAVGTAQKPVGVYPYWQGWDIARSIAVTLDGKGLALLDGFGTVWTMGTVQKLGSTSFGFDIARDLAIAPAGDGYAVLDGFGAIHPFGNVPATPNIGYALYDRWRGAVVRNGRYTVVRNDGYSVS
jgi:Mannosyl-glycoprotein endo-beta-N-acetylglucosaminidase.